MTDLLIRGAREADREAILEVTLSAYEEYESTISPSYWAAYRQNIVDTLRDVSPAEQFVAEEDGAIAGAVLLHPAGPATEGSPHGQSYIRETPEVRLLAVAPEARGRGIGRALMAACIDRARGTSRAITLWTNDKLMHAAVHLYESMGFQRVPELDAYIGDEIVIQGYRLEW